MAAPKFSIFVQIGLYFLLILCSIGYCLYEDQIGKFDWRHQYVGQADFVHFDQSTQSGRCVIVGTRQNVLASLSARNGHILWRQIFEDGDAGKIDDLIQNANSIISLTGGGSVLRNWLSQTGHLLWEASFNTQQDKKSSIQLFSRETDDDSILVLHENRLAMLEIVEGKEIWGVDLPNSDNVAYLYMDVNGKDIAVAGIAPGNQVAILTYTSSGKMVSQMTIPAKWIAKDTSCQMVSGKYFACVASSAIYSIKISGRNAFTKTTLHQLGLPDEREATLTNHLREMNREGSSLVVLQLSPKQHAVVSLQADVVTLTREAFEASAVHYVKNDDNDILLSVKRNTQDGIALSGYSLSEQSEMSEFTQRLTLPGHHGNPTKLYTLGYKKRDGSTGYRYLVISEDHAITLIQQSGKPVWNREEALASVLSVEMVDLPVSENEAKMEDEFGKKEDDMFVMLIKRITTQLSQLKTFFMHLQDHFLKGHKESQDIPDAEEEYPMENLDLTRDNFNLHKMLIITSAAGKVYGMYSSTGHLVWKYYLPDMLPFSRFGKSLLPLFIQRTTAHFPHPPQAAVLGKHRVTGNGYFFVFNPITGDSVEKNHDLGFKVKQVMLHSHTDERFLKGIIFLDDTLRVQVYPKSMEPQVQKIAPSLFMFTVDADKATMSGYGMAVKDKKIQAYSLWNVNLLGENQKITNVVSKRLAEHVHSQGRVLGDRSVLYKYLNPNMVVVTAQGEDATQKSFGFLNIYLIDVVNGNIVFHANHKKVIGPVNVVHSENWVVYNYWNQVKRRNEITVLELYEGNKQSNATTFSSLSPPPPPLVMRQSYIFPTSLTTMAATITEKGISNKHIMIALSMGGIFELSKIFLDPRRPVNPTTEHREEGIIPYIPELPLQTDAFVNYNHSVFNIRGIHTAPAGLESTSLVLAYGLDLFFTRVFPSKMFDMLKEDFDYFFIGSVVVGMIIVSFVTQKLAGRKALNRNWK